MVDQNLKEVFQEAVDYVNQYTNPIPADILLKLYAYYKIATKNFDNPASKTPLINAFKANALIQAQKVSRKEAMESYIELVNKEIRKLQN